MSSITRVSSTPLVTTSAAIITSQLADQVAASAQTLLNTMLASLPFDELQKQIIETHHAYSHLPKHEQTKIDEQVTHNNKDIERFNGWISGELKPLVQRWHELIKTNEELLKEQETHAQKMETLLSQPLAHLTIKQDPQRKILISRSKELNKRLVKNNKRLEEIKKDNSIANIKLIVTQLLTKLQNSIHEAQMRVEARRESCPTQQDSTKLT